MYLTSKEGGYIKKKVHRNRCRGLDYPRMPGEELNIAVIFSWKRKQENTHNNIKNTITFPFILLLNSGGHPCIRAINEENKH